MREEILNFPIPIKYENKKKKTIIILGGSQGAEIFGNTIPNVILELKNKNFEIDIIQQVLPHQIKKIRNFYFENKINSFIFEFSTNIADLIAKSDWQFPDAERQLQQN